MYEGTVTDVNIGNNKLLISTVINGDFYLYPYIFDGAQYHLVGNAINVKEKCGITAMVAATCMQDNWGIFTLYKDSYSIAPVGFAGRALTYYKNILRCFFIRNDGTTSQVQDIGYVPNVVVMTNFTSSVPPIVASPIELSAHITIGGNISKIGKVEKLGNVIYLPLKAKNLIGFYARNNPTQSSYMRELAEMDWGVEILLNKQPANKKSRLN